jgi:hypothetical protein
LPSDDLRGSGGLLLRGRARDLLSARHPARESRRERSSRFSISRGRQRRASVFPRSKPEPWRRSRHPIVPRRSRARFGCRRRPPQIRRRPRRPANRRESWRLRRRTRVFDTNANVHSHAISWANHVDVDDPMPLTRLTEAFESSNFALGRGSAFHHGRCRLLRRAATGRRKCLRHTGERVGHDRHARRKNSVMAVTGPASRSWTTSDAARAAFRTS